MNLPPLKTEEWREVSRLFHASLELPAPARAAWIAEQTKGKDRLRFEVESLLGSHEGVDDFLEKPAAPRSLRSFLDSAKPLFGAGNVTGDFTIERVLGAGSFGTVYLATQNSLGRKIALKVSPNLGAEARTMAHLEHPNIVTVFSEEIHAKSNLRYICMQYVPGTTLEDLLEALPEAGADGRGILETLDRIGSGDGAFDPLALKDRERLAGFDGVDAVLWLGGRVASALAYAHERGILHLDVKPGNILITPYATPMLTDFNVSLRQRAVETGTTLVGGTERYMPPEQRKVVQNPKGKNEPLDGRADIYALGQMLKEMLLTVCGSRRGAGCPDLEFILNRCLAREREDRFENAAALAAALDGYLELRQVRNALPAGTRFSGWLKAHPLSAFLLFTLTPQVVGSLVNIGYNSLRIVRHLTPEQQNCFHWLILFYNGVVYPSCVGLILWQMSGLLRYLREPKSAVEPGAPGVGVVRKRLLNLPLWLVIGVTLGWMPGSVIFPLGIHLGAGPVAGSVFGHFFVSFTLSWLIALTYSFLLIQFFLLRAYYPQFWFGQPDIRATAREELAMLRPTLTVFPYMAGFVPLIGAILVVLAGPGLDRAATFRFLTIALVALGMLGLVLALRASHLMGQTIVALTGQPLSELGGKKNCRFRELIR